jgi:hypothetical protein
MLLILEVLVLIGQEVLEQQIQDLEEEEEVMVVILRLVELEVLVDQEL